MWLVFACGLPICFFLILRTQTLIVVVDGESMSPALRDGDRVLMLRRVLWLRRRRGQIVVVRPSGAESGVDDDETRFIKRLVGLPGDRLTTRLEELNEWLREDHARHYDRDGKRTWDVPSDHIFVRGDAPGSDSRAWGPIPSSAVEGVVLLALPSVRQRSFDARASHAPTIKN